MKEIIKDLKIILIGALYTLGGIFSEKGFYIKPLIFISIASIILYFSMEGVKNNEKRS